MVRMVPQSVSFRNPVETKKDRERGNRLLRPPFLFNLLIFPIYGYRCRHHLIKADKKRGKNIL